MNTRTYDSGNLALTDMSLAEFTALYDSLDLLAPCNRRLDDATRKLDAGYERLDYGGLRSVKQARALMADGWAEGAARIKSIAAELQPPAMESQLRRGVWADEGDELNIDRAMVGQWDDAWRTSKRRATRAPRTVDLVIMWGGSYMRNADELFWKGACGVVIADMIEASGCSVRIVGSLLTYNDYDRTEVTVTSVLLKEAEEPLRIDTLASVLTHAGVFRTLGFRALLTSPQTVGENFGRSVATWEEIQGKLQANGEWPDNTVRMAEVWTMEDCKREIARVATLLQGSE